MKLKIGERYHGFILEKEEFLEEYDSTGRILVHEKTGAKFVQLENDNVDKCFAINFHTIPSDSTGVAHILEHSVLCGSRKYPVKAPFTELLKGSLKTFLNAMTGPDLTYYPVCSKNEKDFMNLMDVYLDATLFPAIYHKKEILMQEGHHFELDSLDGELSYKGVVYNEMKGAYSNGDAILNYAINETLFDNCYNVSSGGDPLEIPKLTQEEFLKFHKKYYHPSNSLIFLSGDMDLLKVLKFVNDEYLTSFDKQHIDFKIEITKPFTAIKEKTVKFSISEGENEKEKAKFSLNFMACESKDIETAAGLTLLSQMLLTSHESPLWKALVDSGLCRAISVNYDSSKIQTVISFIATDCDEANKYEIKTVLLNTLKDIVKNGINKDTKESIFNNFELNLREPILMGYPKSIVNLLGVTSAWIQGIDLFEQIKYKDLMASLRTKIDGDYFENLIREYVLENNHGALVIGSPEKNLVIKENEKLKEELKKYKESLSKEQLQEIIDNCNWLKDIQKTPDNEEDLKKIPMLKREDLDINIDKDIISEKSIKGYKTLHVDTFTKGISYVTLAFDIKRLNREELQYIQFMSTIIQQLSTKNYSNEKLTNLKKGLFGYSVFVNSKYENIEDDTFKYFHSVSFNCLNENMEKAFKYFVEIIENINFDERKIIKQILELNVSALENEQKTNGMSLPVQKIMASFIPASAFEEPMKGMPMLEFLKDIRDNFDSKIDSVIEKLYDIKNKVYNKNAFEIHIAGKEEELKAFEDNIEIFTNALDNSPVESVEFNFKEKQIKEGIINLSKVNYAYKGYDYKKLGYKGSGALEVAKTILNSEYLWNKVRVEGGAYGSSVMISGTGTMLFTSYRDPNIAKTLAVYDSVPSFLETFNCSEETMLKYIIGTLADSNLEGPMLIKSKALTNYYGRSSYDRRLKTRKEILNTTAADIRSLKPLFEAVLNKNHVAAIGSKEKIEEAKDYFDIITKLV